MNGPNGAADAFGGHLLERAIAQRDRAVLESQRLASEMTKLIAMTVAILQHVNKRGAALVAIAEKVEAADEGAIGPHLAGDIKEIALTPLTRPDTGAIVEDGIVVTQTEMLAIKPEFNFRTQGPLLEIQIEKFEEQIAAGPPAPRMIILP